MDITLRKTLDALLKKHREHKYLFDDRIKHQCVVAWHSMPAWPEVSSAIEQLETAGYEVFVFTNCTTRLQLDLCKPSGLKFNMLFPSELCGIYKPAPKSCRKTLEYVNVKLEESVMVAAHADDGRGAKEAGMKTVYIDGLTTSMKHGSSQRGEQLLLGGHDEFCRGRRRALSDDRQQRLARSDSLVKRQVEEIAHSLQSA